MAGVTTQLFGIEVNFVLILLIITLILVFCFFLLLWEIYSLKKLLTLEKTEIVRFEQDITKLEGDAKDAKKGKEKTQANQALTNYIKDSLGRGLNRDQIRGILQRRGWSTKDIDNALNAL